MSIIIKKADIIQKLAEEKTPILAICGGFQLFGKYFKTSSGKVIEGIGIFNSWTIAGNKRFIGDVIIESNIFNLNKTLVGFENHSGKTYLDQPTIALGKVIIGYGNNNEDKLEGAIYKETIGTYLHGSLLPKNPWLADYLISKALEKKYNLKSPLIKLDDSIEINAHKAILNRIRKRGQLNTGAR